MQSGEIPGSPGGGEGETADPLLGRTIAGKFVLDQRLGAGAMGAVYRARQTALEKTVAIKVMHGELARDPMFAARFHREAKAASRLDHPNSIRILDYGQDPDGLLYIAMEYLDGRDLAYVLEREFPLPSARIVDVLSQALGAVAVAHDLGITHRDLKPENIMVLRRRTDDGVDIDVVKVCDFGIAKLVEAGDATGSEAGAGAAQPQRGKLTTAGLVIGTPAYMSPEQGRGEAIDGRSDLYSMGVILYQLLTGQLPFDGPSAIGIVLKHQVDAPPPPSSVRPDVDARLEAVCLRALQKAPRDRYATARDFRAAIRGAVPLDGAMPASADGHASPSAPRLAAAEPAVAIARTEVQLGAVGAPAPAVSAMMTAAPPMQASAPIPPRVPQRRLLPIVAGAFVTVGAVTAAGFTLLRPRTQGHVMVEPPAPAPAPAPAPPGPSRLTAPPRAEWAAPTETVTLPTNEVVVPRHGRGIPARSAGPSPRAVEPARAEPPAPPPPAAVAPAPPLAPTPPPPVAPVVSAAPTFDVTTASVTIGAATNTQQIGGTPINDLMSHKKGALERCYRDALPNMRGPLEGRATLHIEADEDGRVTRAQLRGPVIGGRLVECVNDSLVNERLSQHDTGAPSADVPIELRAR